MKPERLSWLTRLSWPSRVWVVGALLALAFYFARAVHAPARSAVGVERRLFPLGRLSLRLHESPEGGRWLVVPGEEQSSTPPPAPGWLQRVTGFTWPEGFTPRRLAPFRPSGTWWLRDGTLWRAWRFEAQGWLDGHRLWGHSPDGVGEVLDLRTGRTRLGDNLVPSEVLYGADVDESDAYETTADVEDPLAEGGDAFAGSRHAGGRRLVGGRPFFLVETLVSPALCAVSDDPAPRIVPLARDATFAAMSRDGRTLFFTRRGALWRLDLRKPVPELLDEVAVPELP